MTFTYTCHRPTHSYMLKFDSLEEAVGTAWADLDIGNSVPFSIVDENGNVILEGQELLKAAHKLD